MSFNGFKSLTRIYVLISTLKRKQATGRVFVYLVWTIFDSSLATSTIRSCSDIEQFLYKFVIKFLDKSLVCVPDTAHKFITIKNEKIYYFHSFI